jgi:hypothetical protein
MKNKRLTYFLVPLVLFIWGIIFYKIYTHLNKPNDNPLAEQSFGGNSKVSNVKDSFIITANYRDPFLSGQINPIRKSIIENRSLEYSSGFSRKSNNQTEVVVPDIKYHGQIANSNKNQKIGLFKLNNKEIILKEGELFEGFNIKKLFNDSVKVLYGKLKKTIKKNAN